MVKFKIMNRVNKEVKLLEDYYGKDAIEVRTVIEDEDQDYVINIYKNKHSFFNVKLILKYDYPFKDPSFCLYYFDKKDKITRTIQYFDFFEKCSIFYFIKNKVNLVDHLCPCCYHAICNRQLNESLLELSKDVQKFSIQFMRLREKYFVKKYINVINHLDENIIDNILSYI